MLSRDEILRKSLAKKVTIHVVSLDGEVNLKQLSSSQVMGLTEKYQNGELTQEDYTYAIVVMSVIDDDGLPVFDDVNIKEMSVEVMTELAQAIGQLNNLDVERAKADANLKKVRSKHS